MSLNFNYDANFTNNWVKTNTKESEEVVEMMTDHFSGFTYLKSLFRNYPELFDNDSATLFYIEYAGRRVSSDYLYLAFEQFMTNSNNNIVKAMLNDIPLYTIKQDPIIQWARYLQHTSYFTIFEPVLNDNNNALKSFIGNSKSFHYKNIPLSISKIKPLCVNNNGENIAELLIYIAYLFNFFINLRPYIFNEIVNGSSSQSFMLAIEEHVNEQFNKLITLGRYVGNGVKPNSTKELYSDVSNIESFDDVDAKKVIKDILNFKVVRDIRDNVLRKNDPELTKAVHEQNTITQEHCYKCYLQVMENLVDIVVKHNYFNKNILSKLPVFNENNYSVHELMLLTSYTLTGGTYPFIINNYEQYEGCLDPKNIQEYPNIHKQQLLTKIISSKLVNKKPFVSSNIFLDIITGYLIQEFETYQNEVFTHPPILVEEKDIQDIDKRSAGSLHMDELLNKLYLNGKFNLFTSQMRTVLNYLDKQPEFNQEFKQILMLANLCSIIYKNKFGSMLLSSYILSYIPEYITLYCYRNRGEQTLSKFSFIKFFCLQHDKLNEDKVMKLANMEMSLLYLHDKNYIKFVNKTIDKITKIIITNSRIVQPYVIATSSNIQVVPIGGISLGSRFIDTNPLTRGYYFVVNTQGNSEELFTFYNFIKNIGDKEIRAYKYADQIGNKSTALDIIYNEILTNGKGPQLPVTLMSFSFDEISGKYSMKTSNFYKELKTSNGITIDELLNDYSFNAINAKDSQQPKFYSRSINVYNEVSKPVENAIMFGSEKMPCSISDRAEEYELPVYDFSTLFQPVELSFVQPHGYNLIKVYTPNNEFVKNNLFFIFTQLSLIDDEDKQPVFNIYDTINNGLSTGVVNTNGKASATIFDTNLSTNQTAIERMSNVVPTRNSTFATTRMSIIGKDTGPVDQHVKF